MRGEVSQKRDQWWGEREGGGGEGGGGTVGERGEGEGECGRER